MELTRARIISIAVTFALTFTGWGCIIAIQPPFYPLEAEKKGARPSQYGFVFGMLNLTAFIFAPLFGRYGGKVGSKVLFIFGAFTQGIVGISFGFLDFIQTAIPFLTLSYIFRFVQGVADAAAWGASLSILIDLFPNKVATLMSYTEMCIGVGYMLGPALGSFLYEMGGFILPYEMVGSILLVSAFGIYFSIPDIKCKGEQPSPSLEDSNTNESVKRITLSDVVTNLSILMPHMDNAMCYAGFGMIESMLEPHMVQTVDATQRQVGYAFLISGVVYMFFTLLVGYLCDRTRYPAILSIIGNSFYLICFLFIGPIPAFKIKQSLSLFYGLMAVSAAGNAFCMVSTYGRAHKAALRKGFEDNMDTYLLISSTWSSSFFLGNFLGPTLAGFSVEYLGFRATTIGYVIAYAVVLFIDFLELTYTIRISKQKGDDELELIIN